VLEDESGQVKLVDGEALAGLFELFADRLECVVLNGCYTQVQAEAIARHIPYVIGMSQGIQDRAAIEFAVGFYNALGAGRPVEFAWSFGCSAIQMAGIRTEHLIPVLIKKKNEPPPLPPPSPPSPPLTMKITQEVLDIRKAYRIPLTHLIATYYKQQLQDTIDTTCLPDDIPVLSKPHFLPNEPLEISHLTLEWDEEEQSFAEPTTQIASILQSQKPENELYDGYLYRLLSTNGEQFCFCPGSYFKFFNTCEYLSYELAHAIVNHQVVCNIVKEGRQQDFQKVVDFLMENEQLIPQISLSDPFDFPSRCTAFGTCALVIIKRPNDLPQFILNRRSEKLSETPALLHVIPAGTFQPNFNDDRFHQNEFSFRENIVREFVEELLEDKCLRLPDAQDVLNFIDMYPPIGQDFRRGIIEQNRFSLWYLGMVIDPMNLKPEILTVLMIHEAELRCIKFQRFQKSWETGKIERYEFTKDRLKKFLKETLVPTGKAHIWLALKHFNFLSSKLANL
jgi:hypothetical protein